MGPTCAVCHQQAAGRSLSLCCLTGTTVADMLPFSSMAAVAVAQAWAVVNGSGQLLPPGRPWSTTCVLVHVAMAAGGAASRATTAKKAAAACRGALWRPGGAARGSPQAAQTAPRCRHLDPSPVRRIPRPCTTRAAGARKGPTALCPRPNPTGGVRGPARATWA